MHLVQIEWIQKVKGAFPDFFQDKRVLDVGSLDVNGNNGQHFNQCRYYGIDIGAGNNVDFVSYCHDFTPKKFGLDFDQFDTIISTECFEHDEHYAESLRNICRLLRSGGLFVFTCATIGREEHGTVASGNLDASPFTGSYYKNLTEADIRSSIDINLLFSMYQFDVIGTDLRFFGIKKPYLTDKLHLRGYTEGYSFHFGKIKDKVTKVLEIGILDGESLRLWADYFPNATIVGVDIAPKSCSFDEGRILLEIGDATDPMFIASLISKYGNFDIVLDDGSHLASHMRKSFELLYPVTNFIYCIEDLVVQYPDTPFGNNYLDEKAMMNDLYGMVDNMNAFSYTNKISQVCFNRWQCYIYKTLSL